jgi:hypothetical protein
LVSGEAVEIARLLVIIFTLVPDPKLSEEYGSATMYE